MNNRTAIVIPVYNEAEVIKGVINSLLKHFKYVVCVNDGSDDNSSKEIIKTKAYLINHPMNMGQGAALQTAIEFARLLPVDYFVTFDADGQHDVADALQMLGELKNSKYDIILGSRFLGHTTGINRLKITTLKLAIKFSNLETGLKLTDTHNGIRAFNRRVADAMHITLPDMAHASEILGIIATNKFKYKEVPVTIKYTEYSKRKGQSITNAVNIAFDIILRKLNTK
jgi:glycosyltransferase involved in cell wall biosynthesis